MTASENADYRMLLDAAKKHWRSTETLLAHECWSGDCEHNDCPEVPTDVCRACLSFAWDIDEERVPERVLADNCPILLAVEALSANDGSETL